MCYNNCEHFRFNPVTGTDRCVKGKAPCPDDIEEIEEDASERNIVDQ